MTGRALMMIASLVGTATTHAVASEPEVFFGYARDLESGEYLYTERHTTVTRDGRWQSGTIEYFDPDGGLLGTKVLDFSSHPYIPVYTLELVTGYREGISAVGEGGVRMFRQKAGEAVEQKSVELEEPMAADSGFHKLIVAHLDALMEGEKKKFEFGVAGSLDSFKFRVRKLEDTTFEGESAVLLKVEPASLLRLVAPSLELVYDPVAGRLLEYRGLSNLQNPESGENYRNVRISYLSEPPPEALKAPGLAAD